VRGIYYEGWHPAGTPTKERHIQEFGEHVFAELPKQFPENPLTVIGGVFEVLWEKLDPGEFSKLMEHLPSSIRSLKL
jgi:uncharacterized protein (DUF2267 family)